MTQTSKPAYRVGFHEAPFPIIEGTEFNRKTYNLKCRNFSVDVDVYQCKLKLGESSFTGIATSKVSIAEKLFMGGWNSNCDLDEMETMFKAVQMYCKEYNLELINQYNNWPSFRGCANKIEK